MIAAARPARSTAWVLGGLTVAVATIGKGTPTVRLAGKDPKPIAVRAFATTSVNQANALLV